MIIATPLLLSLNLPRNLQELTLGLEENFFKLYFS